MNVKIKMNVVVEVADGAAEIRFTDGGFEDAPWYQPGAGGDVLDALGRAVNGDVGVRLSYTRVSGHIAYLAVRDPAIKIGWING